MTGQIVRHAAQVEAVRVRFAAVHEASAVVVGDETVYGRLCRWIIGTVLEKHARQDELVAYVEENLRLIVAGLYDLYGVEPPGPDPVREAALPTLVAPVPQAAVPAMERTWGVASLMIFMRGAFINPRFMKAPLINFAGGRGSAHIKIKAAC